MSCLFLFGTPFLRGRRCWASINHFISASCVKQRVRIVGNGCTLRSRSYLNSLRSKHHLACPERHGRTGLARGNTDSDKCVQYPLSDQGPEGAGSLPRMAHNLGRSRLSSASPLLESGKTFGLILVADCGGFAVSSQELPFICSLLSSFKREPVYKVYSRVQIIFIPISRRCYLSAIYSSFTHLRHPQILP